jgi:hypothetical protein
LIALIACAAICKGSTAKLVRITVHPMRAELRGGKAEQSLLVTAVHSDGTQTDVTSRAQFRPGREDVVRIDQDGVVTPLGDGNVSVHVTFQGRLRRSI